MKRRRPPPLPATRPPSTAPGAFAVRTTRIVIETIMRMRMEMRMIGRERGVAAREAAGAIAVAGAVEAAAGGN